MRSSDSDHSADKAIDAIMMLLDENRVAGEIDEPIDQAARAFRFEAKEGCSHCDFNRIIGRFVSHLYKTGLRLPRHLSTEEAFAEAVFLLKKNYPGAHEDGYDVALMDASDTKLEGIEQILSGLAESIKEAEREKYMEWVFLDNVDQLDWNAKLRMAAVHQKRNTQFFPPDLLALNPSRLAHQLWFFIKNSL